MLEATMTLWWWLSRHALRIQGNQPSQESGLTSKSWMIQVMSAFQATVGSRFAPLVMLENIDGHPLEQGSSLHSSWTSWQATPEEEALGYAWDPWTLWPKTRAEEKRGASQKEPTTREIKRKIMIQMKMTKETWLQSQRQEVEACLTKNRSKKTYQLVKDLTTEKQGKSTTI